MESLFALRKVHSWILPILLYLVHASAWSSTDASILWLQTQQQASGGFVSPSSSQFLATTEVLEISKSLGNSNQAYYISALNYLNAPEFDGNTEGLSRRIAINYRSGVNTSSDVAELLLRKNRDGGFGSRVGYDSTIFDTVFALWALGSANISSSTVTDGAINFIINAQSVRGGWSFSGEQDDSLSLTASVLETLRLYSVRYNLTTNISKASDFLFSMENAAGGWGNNELTIDALIALIPVTIDASKYSKSLNLLKSSQNQNQSWDNDAYITARALRVIYLSQNLPPPVIASDAVVTGQVVDKVSGLPIGGVSVTLSGADSATSITDSAGKFSLTLNKIGNYSLTYSLLGFNSKAQSFSLVKLQSINAGAVQLEKNTQVDLHIAVISGIVKDAIQGGLLQGAQVQISGSNTISVTTNSLGEYQATLASAGDVTISIGKLGYQTVSANATAVLGQAIAFSPSLYTENTPIPVDITLSGKIVDANTNTPIASSKLTFKQNSSEFQTIANESGQIVVPHLSAGNFSFQIDAAGYESIAGSGVAALGSKIDLGTQRLKPKKTFSTVFGTIKNASGGSPISGATIKVIEESAITTSKADGSYSFTNIAQSQFSVEISESGFKSEIYQINAPEFQNIQIDVQLVPLVNPNGFGINNIEATKSTFGAYEKAAVNAFVYNNGALPQELQMVMEIRGKDGFFKRFPAAHSAFPGDLMPDSILVLAGNTAPVTVEFNWLTGTMPPGDYQLSLIAYDARTLGFVSKKTTSFKIVETKNITSLVAKIAPKFAYYHARKEIVLTAEATNASNVDTATVFKYRWKDPQGNILKEGSATLAFSPEDTHKLIELARFTHFFEKSGDFTVEVESIDGGVAASNIVQDKISVSPAIRIDASLDISPTVVTPEQDKTIRLNIKLTGKDEN